MAKYYATEAAIAITNNALQVLGGSGYMRDYPIERYLRDARITNIYEGTSQLQVVAITAGLLGGHLEPLFDDYAARSYEGPTAHLAPEVVRSLELYREARAYLKEHKDRDYTDYRGRQLADMAIDVYLGFRLLELGESSDEKARLAEIFVPEMALRVRANRDAITSGHRALLDAYESLLGLGQ